MRRDAAASGVPPIAGIRSGALTFVRPATGPERRTQLCFDDDYTVTVHEHYVGFRKALSSVACFCSSGIEMGVGARVAFPPQKENLLGGTEIGARITCFPSAAGPCRGGGHHGFQCPRRDE